MDQVGRLVDRSGRSGLEGSEFNNTEDRESCVDFLHLALTIVCGNVRYN